METENKMQSYDVPATNDITSPDEAGKMLNQVYADAADDYDRV